MRNFDPKSKQFNERKITRSQDNFTGGMYNDIVASKVPANGVYYALNYDIYEDRIEARGGSKAYSSYAVSSLCSGDVNCLYYHKISGKVVIQKGTRLFVSDSIAMTSWTEIAIIADSSTSLADSISVADEKDSYVYLFNANYIYKANLDTNICIVVNAPVPDNAIAETAETTTKVYGRRYLYRYARLSGTDPNRQMNTSGVTIEQVSGSCAIDSNHKDYAEIWTERPVGDSTYGVLTGDTLVSPYDSYAQWRFSPTWQFSITIDGTTKNIICSAGTITSMNGVASQIEKGLQVEFPSVTCTYSVDHFVITNPNSGGTITVTSAGSGALDVGSSIMKCESGTGTVTNPVYSTSVVLSPLGLSVDYSKHWTHYQVFCTKNIGKDIVKDIDKDNGGNSTELFIWVGDIPLKKALVGTVSSNVLTVSAGEFSDFDVGSYVTILGYSLYKIVSYTNSNTVTLTGAPDIGTPSVCGIGSSARAFASQSGTTVTLDSTSTDFHSSDVGRVLYFATEETAIIKSVTDITHAEVYTSATISSTGMVWGGFHRNVNVSIGDKDLGTRINGYSLENRFFKALPSSNDGAIANAFMFVANRGEGKLYYSQMAYTYLAGYYSPDNQVVSFTDSISHISEFTDRLIIYCSHSTHAIPINTFDEIATPSVGEYIAVIAGQQVLDSNIGLLDYSSHQKIGKENDIFVTNSAEVRVFNGYKYSNNLADKRIMKKIRKLKSDVASSYSTITGYMLYGKTASSTYVCYKCSVIPEQGVGFVEYSGTYLAMPLSRSSVVKIFDSNNQVRLLVVDKSDNLFYDVSTREGYEGSGLSKIWKDKVEYDGTGGHDVEPSLTFAEDEGSFEHFFLEHLESHVYVRPYSETDGMPTGIEFSLSIYEDGEPTTASATTANIPQTGDIIFDKKIEAHRLQLKVSANMGEHLIVGRQQYYIAKNRADTPSKRTMTEADYQEEFALPVVWAWENKNRVNNTALTGTQTLTTGISGLNSAMKIYDNNGHEGNNINLGNVDLTNGSISFWWAGYIAPSVYIGGVLVSPVPAYGSFTSGGRNWEYYCATGVTMSGELVLYSNAGLSWEYAYYDDVRVFNSTLSSGAITYMKNDVINNSGSIMLPST